MQLPSTTRSGVSICSASGFIVDDNAESASTADAWESLSTYSSSLCNACMQHTSISRYTPLKAQAT